jgi:hypothetical protein
MMRILATTKDGNKMLVASKEPSTSMVEIYKEMRLI